MERVWRWLGRPAELCNLLRFRLAPAGTAVGKVCGARGQGFTRGWGVHECPLPQV